jgi:hypothetical protein
MVGVNLQEAVEAKLVANKEREYHLLPNGVPVKQEIAQLHKCSALD